MRKLISIMVMVALLCSTAVAHNLIPEPQSFKLNSAKFSIKDVRISTPVLQDKIEQFVADNGGTVNPNAKSVIEVKLVDKIAEAKINMNEAYRLKVESRKVSIEATTEQGVYWALQTLAQLKIEGAKTPLFTGAQIVDWPAFRVRGFMHDVGRSYIGLDELKRNIEMLSRYKINVFHWHLTENQSWRLESEIFPSINDSINTTRMPGKFYTLKEAKELVEFCKEHNMMLIPEFDMPGHSAAFIRTFHHDMQSKNGMIILKLLMDEVCETFDVPYIHIGTDEVRFTNNNFVSEMVEFIRSKGKKVISWAPGWNYKPGEIDMQQMWSYKGKATPGIPAIDSKFHYLNHFDIFGDIVGLYTSQIYGQDQGSDDIAGTIVAIWNDRAMSCDRNLILENHLYPNMLAIAERSWRGGGLQYYDEFGTILESTDSPQFKMFADFENRMLKHKKLYFEGYPFGYIKQTHAKWNITEAFPNGGDFDKSFEPETKLKESYSYDGKEYGVKTAIGSGIYLRHVWGEKTVPGFYKSPQENHTAYAYTYVYSPVTQEVGMWIEFQNYGRSEMDIAPPQGKWDYKGSRIWLNDSEIAPPRWTAEHTVRSNESLLGNENALSRKPTMVTLNKGWNKVFLKLPVGKFRTADTRLTKWMFGVAFVNENGTEGIEGLKYSTKIR